MNSSQNYADLLEKGMRKRKKKDQPVITGRARSMSDARPNSGRDIEDMLKPEKRRQKRKDS